MKKKFVKNLFQHYLNKSLAPFYIISGKGASGLTTDFLHEISKNHYKTSNSTNSLKYILDNQDILLLDKQSDKKEYTVNDPRIIELNKFLSYCPIELKYKIIIFKNSHLISTTILNKFLKFLEEPPVDFCIIFENPILHQFLPTIESRSIQIILSNPDLSDIQENELAEKDKIFLKKYLLKENNVQEFIQKYKEKKQFHSNILAYFIQNSYQNNAEQYKILLNVLKKFDYARKFNRGTLEIIASYSQYIIECDTLIKI